MTEQQSAATGLTNGLFQSDPAAGYKGGIAFLDSVSPEEKGSFEWAQQRAAGQFGYESAMRQKGEEPEKLDSDNPVVKMIKGAMDALRAINDPSKTLEDMPQYKQAQEYCAAPEWITQSGGHTRLKVEEHAGIAARSVARKSEFPLVLRPMRRVRPAALRERRSVRMLRGISAVR